MNFTQAFKMSIKSIWGNKGRSFLTMLGIIIGVCAVIIMISIVQGSTKTITDQLETMGTNLISVNITGRGSNKKIDMTDVNDFIQRNKDVIETVAPTVNGGTATVKFENINETTSLSGTNEAAQTVQNMKVKYGRFLSAEDVAGRKKVVLLGTYISNKLFGNSSPLGKDIKIKGDIFTVVGVLEEKSNSSQGSTDDKVVIPYTTAQRLMKNVSVNSYSFQAKTNDTVDAAMAKIDAYLLKVFKSTDAYRVMNQKEILDTVNQMTGILTLMLAGIAGISLLVGGIGIMNIMLVSVTERTREIGIRKAVGARRRSIMTQFLIEAIVVSCMGGLLGILLGFVGSNAIGSLMKITATPSLFTILLSVGFSVGVGVFFGWYPANKASKLNPIEALRYE